MRWYFFQKKNGEYVDFDESLAYIYFRSPDLRYVGWSEGRFVAEAKRKMPATKYDKETKMMKKPTKAIADLLKAAYLQEVEFARDNPDKSPPPDKSRLGLREQDERNPALKQYFGGLK